MIRNIHVLGDLERPPGLCGPGGENVMQWGQNVMQRRVQRIKGIYWVCHMLAHADAEDQREKGNKTNCGEEVSQKLM